MLRRAYVGHVNINVHVTMTEFLSVCKETNRSM